MVSTFINQLFFTISIIHRHNRIIYVTLSIIHAHTQIIRVMSSNYDQLEAEDTDVDAGDGTATLYLQDYNPPRQDVLDRFAEGEMVYDDHPDKEGYGESGARGEPLTVNRPTYYDRLMEEKELETQLHYSNRGIWDD